MPQSLLPMIPAGASRVSDLVSVVRENGQWTYFCGVQPVFRHPEADRRSFRMFTAQLVCRGVCRQVDIVRTFGVSKNSVKRSGADAAAEMGTACTRPAERVLAALGMLDGAPTRFEPCRDVSYGGVLCALPGLIENGLLRHLDQALPTLSGYYTSIHVLLLLAYRARFVLIFDREGYSPAFFKEMWQQHRVACITYHKYPKEPWREAEFAETEVTLPAGERVSLKLAERGSWIGGRSEGLWVREIRKRTESGHQTSLISSAYRALAPQNAAALFSRWSQENFFRYMMEHFAIDLLSEYGTEVIPGTNRPVVNPKWRELDRQSRTLKGKLVQRQARFAALTLHPESDKKEVSDWEKRKTILVEEIEQLEHDLDQVTQQLKGAPKHVTWEELSAEQKFSRLAPSRKRLTDTVKMLAYRAETALTAIVREELAREDDGRALLRDLFRSEADLLPDTTRGVLEVRVHAMANPRSNRAIVHLLAQLNDASINYPGTNLKLIYAMAALPPSIGPT